MSQPPQKHEVTNLVELEERREPLRRGLRIWHLLLPTSGDDLRAYKSLLKYAKPYRGKILLSIALSLLSAIFMGGQLALMNGALVKIFSSASMPPDPPKPGEKAPAPPANPQSVPGAEKPTAPEPTEHEKTFVRSVKDWWEEKRTAFENWIYDRLGIPRPPIDPGGENRRNREKSELLNLCAVEKAQRAALLWILCGLLVVFTVLASVAKYGQSVIVTGASRRVVRDIRAAVFGHLMSLSVRFHQKNHSAQLVSRITSDLEIFGRFLTEALIRFIQDGFEFLVMLIFVAANSGGFIFVIVAVIAVAVAPVNHIAKKLRHNDKKTQAGMAEVATVIQEVLTGQRVVKAFAAEGREIARFRKVTRTHMKSQMKTRRLRSLTEPIVMGIGALGVAAIIVVGGYRVLDGKMDGASLIINVMALGKAMANLRGMSKQLSDFQLGLAAADRVGTVLQARSEIREKPDARPLPPFSGEIRFDAVRFHHDPEKPTLQGIDLRIRKGEKVALVGPSGAGKSTIIDLVPRFFDVESGAIRVDGHDVRDVTLASLREQIGIVSQETVLFRDSIRDNIAYGKPGATDEQIVAAAQAANAHDFIVRKPGGYAWRVGERGHTLSGGERQRIAIARAILLDPPILILDEATSALDSESESIVQAALQRLMVGRTVIVIAHRLSTIRDADRIVVLEKGKVAEIGSHDELMGRQDSLYRRHYEIQTRSTVTDGPG
jgi:subfamily B ATP-binding cassette protein MsbA